MGDTEKPKMTIGVLVSCTRAKLITGCLHSLSKQRRKPDEIIVILRDTDEQSNRAIDILIQQNLIEIKKVFVAGCGVIEATNAGIKNCSSDILCFIDDDAQAREDWIERIEPYYVDANIGGVGGRDIVHSEGGISQKKAKRVGQISWYGKVIGNHHNIIDKACKVSHLKGCNMSYRIKALSLIDANLKANEQMPEPYWELDMGLLVREKGYEIIYDPKIIVEHYPYKTDEDWNKRQPVTIRNQIYVLLKHIGIIRKIIFIFYTLFIGNKGNPGFMVCIIAALKTVKFKDNWHKFLLYVRYKIEGIKNYLKWKNSAKQSDRG